MKYMGSKKAMLRNGLGELIRSELQERDRLVDLFSGSASVSWYAAVECGKAVLAIDLQRYAAIFAGSIIQRTYPVSVSALEREWLIPVTRRLFRTSLWKRARRIDDRRPNAQTWVKAARTLCASCPSRGPMWRAYGGYYFSPTQALILDGLRVSVPDREPQRAICIAALLLAASRCAASPGHTAQPFGATRSAGPYLREAWLRDPVAYIRRGLEEIAPRHASCRGKAIVGNAVAMAGRLRPTDLAFVDPPYSGVHYSRFYHVLETLAQGRCGPVEGSGRYPPPFERPTSRFSRPSESMDALNELLANLAMVKCSVILTFPDHVCSNGLSGGTVYETAKKYFDVNARVVKTRFSTLGGNGRNRGARRSSDEMMLLLRP